MASDGKSNGALPTALPAPAAPPQTNFRTRPVDLRKQYVSGGPAPWVASYVKSLPRFIDDATWELGADLYERMQKDYQVESCLRTVILQILSDGLTLRPAVDDEDDPGHDEAKRQLGFCERACLRWLEDDTWLEEYLLSLLLGHQLGEVVLAPCESGADAGKDYLESLRVKPRAAYTFVTDVFGAYLGVVGLVPGQATPILSGATVAVGADGPQVLPPEKFLCFTHRGRWGDPRGNSVGRSCYRIWWEKLQAAQEWMKALARFGTPWVWGTTAQDADARAPVDDAGNPTGETIVAPEQQMLNTLSLFLNGGVGVGPFSSDVKLIYASGTGEAFLKKVQACDEAIAKSITLQTLATEQPRQKQGTRAQATVHQDTGALAPRVYKRWVCGVLRQQLFYRLVEWNAGKEVADAATPKVSLSPAEQQDWGQLAGAVGGLWSSKYLTPSQRPVTDELLGLPAPTPEELEPPPEAGEQGGGNTPPGGGKGPENKGGVAGDPKGEGDPAGRFAAFAFNPEQPRDAEGRWVGGSGTPEGGRRVRVHGRGYADAVADHPEFRGMASARPGEFRHPHELTPEEYRKLPLVYRGVHSQSGTGEHVFVTPDEALAGTHGTVHTHRLLPGAVLYPDPEGEEEYLAAEGDRTGVPYSGEASLRHGSAVVSRRHLGAVSHRLEVERALDDGLPVPGHVLARYPKLARRARGREGAAFARKGKSEGDGHWVTIGGSEGEDGKRHGGSPVFIEGGRITKGAPALTGKSIAALKAGAKGEEAKPEPTPAERFRGLHREHAETEYVHLPAARKKLERTHKKLADMEEEAQRHESAARGWERQGDSATASKYHDAARKVRGERAKHIDKLLEHESAVKELEKSRDKLAADKGALPIKQKYHDLRYDPLAGRMRTEEEQKGYAKQVAQEYKDRPKEVAPPPEPTHRQELTQSREYARAAHAKAARKEGIKPAHLHQLAAEIAAHDKEHAEDRKQLLKDARAMLKRSGYNPEALTTNLRSGRVEDEIPGLDEVAEKISEQYAHQFAGHDDREARLRDLLAEGNPQAMSEDEAYEKAREQLREMGAAVTPESKPEAKHTPAVKKALERYENRGATTRGGGLFGGEDLQGRQGFARLPEGAKVVLTEGEYRGRTGRMVYDENEDRMAAEVEGVEGLVPVDYTSIEPLNSAQSWRTEATQGPLEQRGMYTADQFLPKRRKGKPGNHESSEDAPFAWDESKHPRGQPDNAGEFAPAGGGGKPVRDDLTTRRKALADKDTHNRIHGRTVATVHLADSALQGDPGYRRLERQVAAILSERGWPAHFVYHVDFPQAAVYYRGEHRAVISAAEGGGFEIERGSVGYNRRAALPPGASDAEVREALRKVIGLKRPPAKGAPFSRPKRPPITGGHDFTPHGRRGSLALLCEAAALSYPLGESGALFAWDESKHPRGQPGNAGEFAPAGAGGGYSKLKTARLLEGHVAAGRLAAAAAHWQSLTPEQRGGLIHTLAPAAKAKLLAAAKAAPAGGAAAGAAPAAPSHAGLAAAMVRANPAAASGAMVSVRELRPQFPGLTKEAFDRAVLAMGETGLIDLHGIRSADPEVRGRDPAEWVSAGEMSYNGVVLRPEARHLLKAPFAFDPDQPRHPHGAWAAHGTEKHYRAAARHAGEYLAGEGPPAAEETEAVARRLARVAAAHLPRLKEALALPGTQPEHAPLAKELAVKFRGHREALAGGAAEFAQRHAPHNMTVAGKAFRGGEFIPAEDYARASPEEKAAVEGKAMTKGGPGGGPGGPGASGGGGHLSFPEKLPPELKAKGIKAKKLPPEQRAVMEKAAAEFASRLRPDFAALLKDLPTFLVSGSGAAAGAHYVGKGDDAYVALTFEAAHFRMLEKFRSAEVGFMADQSPEGAVRHELGHALDALVAFRLGHHENVALGVYPLDYYASEYARASMGEKVAEFYAAITKEGFRLESLPPEAREVARKILRPEAGGAA